jgi:hypothetical protein
MLHPDAMLRQTQKELMMQNLATLLLFLTAVANAQDRGTAVRLQPFPADSGILSSKVDVITVKNHYGRCGSAVVQVLGVKEQIGNFFTIDGNARVVIIADGGQRSLTIEDALSDYNGVACLTTKRSPYLLIWSNCAGTACGDDFGFTVIDVERLRIVSGAAGDCDAKCAQRLTGSRLPLELNSRR